MLSFLRKSSGICTDSVESAQILRMPKRKPNSIGRGDMVMIHGSPDDMAAERVVKTIKIETCDALVKVMRVTSMAQRAILADVVNRYYRDRAQETAGAASKGERNESIKVMLKLVTEARSDLTGRSRMTLDACADYADDALAWDLRWARYKAKRVTSSVPISSWDLDDIEAALSTCTSKSRGPMPAAGSARDLIASLLQLYEASTGQPATHTPYVKTEYTGLAESDAGRVVTVAAQLIDPMLTGTQINNLIAAWLKRRRDTAVEEASNTQRAA